MTIFHIHLCLLGLLFIYLLDAAILNLRPANNDDTAHNAIGFFAQKAGESESIRKNVDDSISRILSLENKTYQKKGGQQKERKRTASETSQLFPWIDNPQPVNSTPSADRRWRIFSTDDLPSALNLSSSTNFKIKTGKRCHKGKSKISLEMKWKGVRVYDSKIVADQDDTGEIFKDSVDGKLVKNIDFELEDATPKLTEKEAIEIAAKYNNDKIKDIEDVDVQLLITQQKNKVALTYKVHYFIQGVRNEHAATKKFSSSSVENQLAALMLMKISLDDLLKMRKLRNNEDRKPVTLLDARTGKVYESFDGLASALIPTDLLIGNPSSKVLVSRTNVTDDNSLCSYKVPTGRNTSLSLNDKGDAGFMVAKTFSCLDGAASTYDLTNGAQSPRNAAYKWGLDALEYLKEVSSVAMTKNIPIEVHHDGVTAMWTGSRLMFGDGNAYMYPLTEPDIVAHEIAHVFTDEQSGLEYREQSGAISEAYSDMAAVAFMNKIRQETVLTIGHLVTKSKIPLRDLCSPGSQATLLHNPSDPTLDHVSQWTAGTSVHKASGIYSKAFCQLAKTRGWDIQSAFKVFTNANMFYWTPRTTFNSGACGVIKAGRDFMGINTKSDIIAAFSTVGILCSEVI